MEYPTWVPQHLFPFKLHFIDIDGCAVHYVDEGTGPVLLLLHGNPTWSFLYRDIIKGLKHRFRCIAPDYPGFGLSSASPGYDFRPATHARILSEFSKRLKLEDISLMVQDWGGPIGLSLAIAEPNRFHRIIIGNTFAWPVQGDRHFEWFSEFVGGSVGRFAIRHFNAFVNILIPAGTPRRKLSTEIMNAYRGPFPNQDAREPTHIFPREIIQSSEFLNQVSNGLGRLSEHPALILWGDKDFAFREKERKRFESLFRKSKTHILRGAGHYIQEDAADEIVGQIKQWWDEK